MKDRSTRRISAILIATLVGFATAVVLAPTASAVVGGGGPGTGVYSAASLQGPDGSHFCGGAVVNPRGATHSWIITAKHCVQDRPVASIRVRSGKNRMTDPVFEVDKVIVHPAADLALVRSVSRDVPSTAGTAASWPNSTIGIPVSAAGWGQTCPRLGCGNYPVDIHYLDTWFVPDSQCATAIDANSEICVDNPNSGGVCYGDDGAPLLWDNGGGIEIVGIITNVGGSVCGAQPSVAVDVPVFYQWIDTTMKAGTRGP
jgi:secreted trypsin-like serine protease